MKLSIAALLVLATSSASAEVMSLTEANYESATAGKTVFLKLFAPWCGHCKAMAADWEKLAADYTEKPEALVAEVDCTAEGGDTLCEALQVQGFPTLLWGDTSGELEPYEGGRDYDSLSAFASENLKPICSLANMDLCDDEMKAAIEKFQAMPLDELKAKVAEVDAKLAGLTEAFEGEVEKIQNMYEGMVMELEKNEKEIKSETNLGLLKSIIYAKKKEAGGEGGADEL